MNKNASDVILQYLKKDDSLTLEELTQNSEMKEKCIKRNCTQKTQKNKIVPKVPEEGHELSLQQKEVRLKWYKSIRIKTTGITYSSQTKKLLKLEIRKKNGLEKKKKLTSLRQNIQKKLIYGEQ